MRTTVEVKLRGQPPADEFDRVLEILSALGAVSLELFDEDVPPTAIALFEDAPPEVASGRVQVALSTAGIEPTGVEAWPATVGDDGTTWSDAARPVRVGSLWIVPARRTPPSNAATLVRLETGAAFGSGLHETTALCLERLIERSPVERLLDVGTGTGILALSALALGAERVVATDTADDALRVARANAQRNGFERRLSLRSALPEPAQGQFSLVVANIVSAVLMHLAPRLIRLLESKGALVLSGVRPDEAEEVARSFRNFGLRRLTDEARNGWVRLEFEAPW